MFEIVIRNKRIIIKILNRNSVLRWVQFREPYLEVVQNSGEKNSRTDLWWMYVLHTCKSLISTSIPYVRKKHNNFVILF